jgi:hypothetical protein
MQCSFDGALKKVKLYLYRHAGAKGEKRYSFYSFLDLSIRWGEWLALCPGRALTPEKTRIPAGYEAGWLQIWCEYL